MAKKQEIMQGSVPFNPKAKPIKQTFDSIKYFGREPMFGEHFVNENNRKILAVKSFNWYFSTQSSKEAIDFIIEYLTLNERKDEARQFRKVKDNWIPSSIGWLTRMTMMGWKLNEEELALVNKHIGIALEKVGINKSSTNDDEVSPEDKEQAKYNVQQRMREKCYEASGEIESMLDQYIKDGCKSTHNHKPLDIFKAANLLPHHVNDEISHWEKVKAEYQEVYDSKDPDLVEAYSHLKKIQLRNVIKFCDLIISDHNNYVAYKKATKKKTTRKKKVKSPAQLAIKLKFMSEFPELKLTSEKPAKIVGAKEMYAYDTKKRKLLYFVADEFAGTLTVRNNLVEGFDVNKSIQKTLRKPKEQLAEIMKAGKPQTRKLFEKIKSVETKFTGRFNENMVILKVW